MNRADLIHELWELQGEQCGICGLSTRSLVVDHDHGSRLIRGLLCNQCNVDEGRHGDCENRDGCPICTWRRHPAVTWLGYSIAYSDDNTLAEWVPGFTSAVELVAVRRAEDRRCAALIDAALGPAPGRNIRVTPAAVEACFGITINEAAS